MRKQAIIAAIISVLLFTSCSDDFEPEYFDDCGDENGQTEACFVEKRSPQSADVQLAVEIADRYIAVHDPERLPWDWKEGVLMFALNELYRVTGHERYREYMAAWLDDHIDSGYDIYWSDSCPPALTALALYEETGDAAYLQVLEDVFDYLDNVAPRTEEGGISHLGILPGIPPTLWLDSLFMFGMVMNRWGETYDDEARLGQYHEQLGIFASLMQDESGLMLHSFYSATTETDIFWARGNGWVVASGYDSLRIAQLRGNLDEVENSRQILEAQVTALIEAQDETGLWWNIVNRPDEIYLESSASALFTFGIARGYRYGILGDHVLPTLSSAKSGLYDSIRRDEENRPIVTGISGPTSAGDFEDYELVPLEEDLTFGVGAMILALIELSGLPLTGE